VKVLELVPPYVQTQLGGPHQASDPNAIPYQDVCRGGDGDFQEVPNVEEVLSARFTGIASRQRWGVRATRPSSGGTMRRVNLDRPADLLIRAASSRSTPRVLAASDRGKVNDGGASAPRHRYYRPDGQNVQFRKLPRGSAGREHPARLKREA